MTTATHSKAPRGFAAMKDERQREIASKGGKAAHRMGLAHEFTPETAAKAGRLGGEKVSQNKAHMAAIGKLGGQSRGRARALAASKKQTEAAAE